MSESVKNAAKEKNGQIFPRATVHKQILDTAESRPDATMEDIASEVTAASTDLVEKVLDEYGDPADKEPPTDYQGESESEDQVNSLKAENDESTDESNNDLIDPFDAIELSEKQQATLRAIIEDPDATQCEIADRFDVTAATISNRVNSIDGFEWSNRKSIAEQMIDTGKTQPMQQEQSTKSINDLTDRIDELTEHIQQLESRLDEIDTDTQSNIENPELIVKIMHACLHSDQITEDEEIQTIRMFITDN